jgi:DNA repair ATPase RecN
METLLKSKIERDLEKENLSKNDSFIFFFLNDWRKIYPNKSDSKFELELYESFIADIKKQLFGEKQLERTYRLSLIDLLEEYNEKKEALIEIEEAKLKTPEMLASEKKEHSEAAYRLHKKFQSSREIKAK